MYLFKTVYVIYYQSSFNVGKTKSSLCIRGAIRPNPYTCSFLEKKCTENKHIFSKLRYAGSVQGHFIKIHILYNITQFVLKWINIGFFIIRTVYVIYNQSSFNVGKTKSSLCIRGAICPNPYSLFGKKCPENKHIFRKLRYAGDVHRQFHINNHININIQYNIIQFMLK